MTRLQGWSLFIFASVVLAAGPEVPRSRFDELLHEARQAEKAKDYRRAAEVYRDMVALQPNHPFANQNLGLAFYLQGKYADAVAPLEKALVLDPKLPAASLYLGISYYRTNQFTKAITALENFKRSKPADYIAVYWLGMSRLALKSYAEAIADLEHAADAAPKDEEVLYSLARAYADYSAALLNQLLETAPDSAAAHRLRADDALEEGMPRAAAIELKKALAAQPGDAGLIALLEQAEKAADTDANAKPVAVRTRFSRPAELAEMLRGNPRDPDALYLAGKSYEALSSDVGHKLFALSPDSYRVRMMRGEAFEKSDAKDFEKALEEYRKALALKPDLPGAHYAIGRILWKMRRWEEAITPLQQELEKNPQHGLANYYLGNSYLALDRREPAIRHLEAAIRAQPGLTDGHRDLGRALAASGNYEGAIASYQRALAANADDSGIHALLATAYRAAGNPDEARRHAEISRELSAKRNRRLE
jgi:tetratricopeptide (TPR) repeat protein